jgi:hypothetical protein
MILATARLPHALECLQPFRHICNAYWLVSAQVSQSVVSWPTFREPTDVISGNGENHETDWSRLRGENAIRRVSGRLMMDFRKTNGMFSLRKNTVWLPNCVPGVRCSILNWSTAVVNHWTLKQVRTASCPVPFSSQSITVLNALCALHGVSSEITAITWEKIILQRDLREY